MPRVDDPGGEIDPAQPINSSTSNVTWRIGIHPMVMEDFAAVLINLLVYTQSLTDLLVNLPTSNYPFITEPITFDRITCMVEGLPARNILFHIPPRCAFAYTRPMYELLTTSDVWEAAYCY